MSLSATLFGSDSFIHKATNVMGLGIPGYLDRSFNPDPPKQRLGDLAAQTAEEGGARPIIYGRVRPIGCNLIHAQAPVKIWLKQKQEGGKGGSSKKQYVENVFRTYAVGICEGPVTGVIRAWRNNKLVYDARGNEWGDTNNPIFLRSFKFYLGGWDQMPDPTLESIWGVDNVPAYRGTCYMVSNNENLTDLGGAVPQWIFEVERAEGRIYTSKLYGLESVEGLEFEGGISSAEYRATLLKTGDQESLDMNAGISFLNYKKAKIEEDVGVESVGFSSGVSGLDYSSSIRPAPKVSTQEEVDFGAGVSALKYALTRIKYTDPAPEAVDFGAGISGLNYASNN